jgi:hypothetical protein
MSSRTTHEHHDIVQRDCRNRVERRPDALVAATLVIRLPFGPPVGVIPAALSDEKRALR